ncbi:MAG: hypothetical protein LLF89_09745 [Spirochaetaceae bacterium]|nr:hypothetical protein [Spirochaetaceae bacterium]
MQEAKLLLESYLSALPPFFAALLTFLIGWAIAGAIKFLLPKLLVLLRFDRLCNKIGLTAFLEKGKVKHNPSELLGILVFWILMVVTLINTISLLDNNIASSIQETMTSVFPHLLAAGLIVIIGVIIVTFLSNFFVTIARNAAMKNPELIGKAIKTLGSIIVLIIALEQLGMGETIMSALLVIMFAAIALGLALAFGLGCKDMARKAAEGFIRNLTEKERNKQGTDLEG